MLTDRDEDTWIPSIVQQVEKPISSIFTRFIGFICPTSRRFTSFIFSYSKFVVLHYLA